MGEILENMKKAIIEYDSEGALIWATKAVDEGIDPVKALEALTVAIRQIGDGYARGELWLPDLMGAASAMISAMPVIEGRIKKAHKRREKAGTIVIGTVFGDIHDIGKNMVSVLAVAEGFEVIDLGIDVTADKFIQVVKKYNTDILAMSALLTTTAHVQKEVIEALGKANIREKVKVAVGGAAITQEFADMIGADGYRPTAPEAVGLFKELIGQYGEV
jgi:corrinoid protein of di/trimethylamine methyltransferase